MGKKAKMQNFKFSKILITVITIISTVSTIRNDKSVNLAAGNKRRKKSEKFLVGLRPIVQVQKVLKSDERPVNRQIGVDRFQRGKDSV